MDTAVPELIKSPFSQETKTFFVQQLLLWNTTGNSRTMPWKGEKDPYRIWLSEIMLQQTRVEQGWRYYEKFVSTYPNVNALAHASEKDVFKLWEGLGYYSRCRNLIYTAKHVSSQLNGKFPDEYDELLQLKGVGQYTAAAIVSFAFNKRYAVVDGNVFRVLSRFFGISKAIDSVDGKKYFSKLAHQLLPEGKSAVYNQAIMDFGAVICKPAPDCTSCMLSKKCHAFLKNSQAMFPVKSKQTTIKQRRLYFVVLKCDKHIAIQQRLKNDIWKGLHQTCLIETTRELSPRELENELQKRLGLHDFVLHSVESKKQRLTHQLIQFTFATAELKRKLWNKDYQWIGIDNIQEFGFPKSLGDYLKTHIIA